MSFHVKKKIAGTPCNQENYLRREWMANGWRFIEVLYVLNGNKFRILVCVGISLIMLQNKNPG